MTMLKTLIPGTEFSYALDMTEQQKLILSQAGKSPVMVGDAPVDMEVYFNVAPRMPMSNWEQFGAKTLLGEKSLRWRVVSFGGYAHRTETRQHMYHPRIFTVIHQPTRSVVLAIASGGRKGWKKARKRAEEVCLALANSGRATRANKTRRGKSRYSATGVMSDMPAPNPPAVGSRTEPGDMTAFRAECENVAQALALIACLQGSGMRLGTAIEDSRCVRAWLLPEEE